MSSKQLIGAFVLLILGIAIFAMAGKSTDPSLPNSEVECEDCVESSEEKPEEKSKDEERMFGDTVKVEIEKSVDFITRAMVKLSMRNTPQTDQMATKLMHLLGELEELEVQDE